MLRVKFALMLGLSFTTFWLSAEGNEWVNARGMLDKFNDTNDELYLAGTLQRCFVLQGMVGRFLSENDDKDIGNIYLKMSEASLLNSYNVHKTKELKRGLSTTPVEKYLESTEYTLTLAAEQYSELIKRSRANTGDMIGKEVRSDLEICSMIHQTFTAEN